MGSRAGQISTGPRLPCCAFNVNVGRWEVRNVTTRDCVRVRPGNLMVATGGVSTGSASADSHASQAHVDAADPSAAEAHAADNPPAADDVPPTALLDHLGLDELGLVFKELDLKARCTAMQVCTSLRAAGSARPDAWRECDLGSEPRAQLRDEDVARVLRRAGRQLAVLNVSGLELTCDALQPLRDCSGLERLSLTGCACVDARALRRDVLPPGEGYLASLSVDGIDSLNRQSVGRLKSLVRGSQLDVTECDVCEEFELCKACADGCGVQICSEDAKDMVTCDACKRFWCDDCNDTPNAAVCDGPCCRTLCGDCMFKVGAAFCDGCDKRECFECALEGKTWMPTCDVCYTSMCENCAKLSGTYMATCEVCGSCKCEDCFGGAPVDSCDGCGKFTCEDCAGGAYIIACDGCGSFKCEDCDTGEGLMVTCDDCCMATCDHCMNGADKFMHTCDVCFTCQCEPCVIKGGGGMLFCDDCCTTTCNKCNKGSDHFPCCGANMATAVAA